MNRAFRLLLTGVLLLTVFCLPTTLSADPYPDGHKLVPGMPFSYFDISDLFNQRWVSTYLRGRPVLLLTGHRYQRHEILRWADMLKREFADTGAAHVLWVVNLRKVPWTTGRANVIDQWRGFGSPVPVLLDWHGAVGRHLQVNYSAPNIIAIDADGRLAFHHVHTYTPDVYSAVAGQIRNLCLSAPGMSKPMVAAPGENLSPAPVPGSSSAVKVRPSGRKGDSN